jgi:hypothetical protein
MTSSNEIIPGYVSSLSSLKALSLSSSSISKFTNPILRVFNEWRQGKNTLIGRILNNQTTENDLYFLALLDIYWSSEVSEFSIASFIQAINSHPMFAPLLPIQQEILDYTIRLTL